MTRATSVALAALSLLVLGGAWVAARALTSDVKAPPSAVPERGAVRPVLPPPAPAPSPPPTAPVVPTALGAAPEAQPPPPPSPSPVDEEQPTPDPESDFAGLAPPEVEDAFRLITDPGAGPQTWRNAQRTFERCLNQAPGHARCEQGLSLTRQLLSSEIERPPRREYRMRRFENLQPEPNETAE